MVKLLILGVLILIGASMQMTGMLDPGEILAVARRYADDWW
jgi:hypothetical protein